MFKKFILKICRSIKKIFCFNKKQAKTEESELKRFYSTVLLENAKDEIMKGELNFKQMPDRASGKTVEWRAWKKLNESNEEDL